MKSKSFIIPLLIFAGCCTLATQASARVKRKKELKSHFLGVQLELPASSLGAFSLIEIKPEISKPLATGYATWYGPGFHRRKTANGERYNMHAKTCASPNLPFNTWIEITNLDNGKKSYARINDRLPPRRKSVILDASLAIAKDLDFVKRGKARIEIRKIEKERLAVLNLQ